MSPLELPERPQLTPFMETAAAKQLVADIAETEKLTEALREGVIEADGARRSAIQAHSDAVGLLETGSRRLNALRQALGELRAQAEDEDDD